MQRRLWAFALLASLALAGAAGAHSACKHQDELHRHASDKPVIANREPDLEPVRVVAIARADEEAVTEAAVVEEPDISASKVTEAEPIPDRCGAAHTAFTGP
jgi:hypothetical protein